MVTEVQRQAILSAVRSVLIAVGAVLTQLGFASDDTIQAVAGLVGVIGPVLWGVWDKFHTEEKTVQREVAAVNAGIVVANEPGGPAQPVSPSQAKDVLQSAK